MNCKPGDRVMVIGGRMNGGGPAFGRELGQTLLDALLGRVAQVSHLDGDAWVFFEPLSLGGRRLPLPDGRVLVCAPDFACRALGDEFLLPLPDLGDDDEVLRETDRPVEVAA